MGRVSRVFLISTVLFTFVQLLILFSFGSESVLVAVIPALVLFWGAVLLAVYADAKLKRDLWEYELDATWVWQDILAKEIVNHFQPLVRVLTSYSEVSLAARSLIVAKDARTIFLDAKVVFLGAAGNQSEKSRRDALALKLAEDTERTPAQIYQGAIEELMSSQTPVFRVVGLLTDSEFSDRSREKRAQYLSWLRHQVGQLKKNRNYVIFDNRRAPVWGSSGATIFSPEGFLQQTGVSGEALFVRDEWITRNLLSAVMREMRGAKPENKPAFSHGEEAEMRVSKEVGLFGEKLSVSSLEKRLMTLEELA